MGHRSFVRLVFRRLWALLSSAILTIVGFYALLANKGRSWLIAADLIAAAGLFYIAVFLAWRDERKERIQAEQRALVMPRPKIVPIDWGKRLDRTGLIVRNDGEPAFDIFISEPIHIGGASLTFLNRTRSGLAKPEGELLLEAHIKLSSGTVTSGYALRDVMIEAKQETIAIDIRYRDFNGRSYTTPCEVVKEFWENGLRVRLRFD